MAVLYDALGRPVGNYVCSGTPSVNCQGETELDAYWIVMQGQRVTEACTGPCTTYGYDEFNRLSSSNFNNGQQAFSWTYDRWGNRWDQNVTSGSGPQPQLTFNTNNNQLQQSGSCTPPISASETCYDAAGDLIADGSHTYSYDADGNQISVDDGSTASVVYDALNEKVHEQTSSGTTEYLFDADGRVTSNWVTPTFADEGHIFWDGTQIAFRSGNGLTYFAHKDWVNTDRMHTDLNGAVAATFTSLAFGDGGAATINGSEYGGWDFSHFADMDWNSEAYTYHAQFRQYSDVDGLWMSPDPSSGSYDFSNPQSLNRYAYVTNSPASFVDPSGLQEGGNPGCGFFCDLPPVSLYCLFFLSCSGSTFHGTLKPRPNAQPWDEYHIQYGPNIAAALGLPDQTCEFGACGSVVFNATPGQTSTIGPTTGAISISGVWVLFGVPLIAGVGPAANVTWVPTKKMLCGGIGVGAAAGHTVSGGPEVVHARQGHTIKDVVSSWSVSGGYNWLPWLGGQGSANTSGGAAGWSFGIPGGSGTATWSWCHVFAGGSE